MMQQPQQYPETNVLMDLHGSIRRIARFHYYNVATGEQGFFDKILDSEPNNAVLDFLQIESEIADFIKGQNAFLKTVDFHVKIILFTILTEATADGFVGNPTDNRRIKLTKVISEKLGSNFVGGVIIPLDETLKSLGVDISEANKIPAGIIGVKTIVPGVLFPFDTAIDKIVEEKKVSSIDY